MTDHFSGSVSNKNFGAQANLKSVGIYEIKRQSSLPPLNGHGYSSSYVYGRNFPDNTLITLVLSDGQGKTYNYIPFDKKTTFLQPPTNPIKYFQNVLPDSSNWPFFRLDSGYSYTLSATISSTLGTKDPNAPGNNQYSFMWFNITDFSFIGKSIAPLSAGENNNQKYVAQISPKITTDVALVVVYNGEYNTIPVITSDNESQSTSWGSNLIINSARCTVKIIN